MIGWFKLKSSLLKLETLSLKESPWHNKKTNQEKPLLYQEKPSVNWLSFKKNAQNWMLTIRRTMMRKMNLRKKPDNKRRQLIKPTNLSTHFLMKERDGRKMPKK